MIFFEEIVSLQHSTASRSLLSDLSPRRSLLECLFLAFARVHATTIFKRTAILINRQRLNNRPLRRNTFSRRGVRFEFSLRRELSFTFTPVYLSSSTR